MYSPCLCCCYPSAFLARHLVRRKACLGYWGKLFSGCHSGRAHLFICINLIHHLQDSLPILALRIPPSIFKTFIDPRKIPHWSTCSPASHLLRLVAPLKNSRENDWVPILPTTIHFRKKFLQVWFTYLPRYLPTCHRPANIP